MKMPHRILQHALAALSCVSVLAPTQAADTVVGSGKLQTETRAIGGFQAVAMRGSMNLVLRQGAGESVEVRADHNLLPLIETRVVTRAGLPTLEIDSKSGTSYTTRSELTVTVDVITLKALTLAGSGNTSCARLKTERLQATLDGSGSLEFGRLDADVLNLRLSGSGGVQAAGNAARIELAVNGSASADLRGLQADTIDVRIAGSGDASVHARRKLTVAISGSGNLQYSGEPVVKRSISGSGSIERFRSP
jgi:Putative auto-transporter adhesin, head GIN domain